jgi:hypothetical protein
MLHAQRLKKNETCNKVTVVGSRIDGNRAFFLQSACNAIQRFIRQFVRGQAVLAVEVENKSAAYLQVAKTARIIAGIEPVK